jgi:hypothetical protein
VRRGQEAPRGRGVGELPADPCGDPQPGLALDARLQRAELIPEPAAHPDVVARDLRDGDRAVRAPRHEPLVIAAEADRQDGDGQPAATPLVRQRARTQPGRRGVGGPAHVSADDAHAGPDDPGHPRRHPRHPRRRHGHRERGGHEGQQPDVLERGLPGGGAGRRR